MYTLKAMIAKARATALCLFAIMSSRVAQQTFSCCCMAYRYSSTSTRTRTTSSRRSASTWARPVAAARRHSSPRLYPNKYQAWQHTGTTHLRATVGSQEILTSLKGATVKRYKSLVSKKRERSEKNATVVEGQRAVLDLLSDSTTRDLVKHIILEEGGMPEQMMKTYLDLVATCSLPPTVIFASSAVVKACSDTITPQGVIAMVSLPAPYQYEASNANVGARTYLVLEVSE